MSSVANGSDKQIGFAVVFAVLGLAGAIAMYIGAISSNQLTAAWGFAGAMIAGGLLVAAIQVYG